MDKDFIQNVINQKSKEKADKIVQELVEKGRELLNNRLMAKIPCNSDFKSIVRYYEDIDNINNDCHYVKILEEIKNEETEKFINRVNGLFD